MSYDHLLEFKKKMVILTTEQENGHMLDRNDRIWLNFIFLKSAQNFPSNDISVGIN